MEPISAPLRRTAAVRLKGGLIPCFKVHPLVWDLGMAAGAQFLVLCVNLLLVTLFGRLMGAAALGEYLLLRRVVNGLQSGVQMGLGVAVPRYVAGAVNRPGREREAYFLAGVSCLVAFALCGGFVMLAGREQFARWLLGSAQATAFILPLALWLLGLAAHVAVYGYYRGCLFMGRATGLQVCNLVVVPLVSVAALFHTRSVPLIMSCIGVSMLACAGLFAAPILAGALVGGRPRFGRHATELLRYGIPRMPGDFGGGALLAAGPMIASHYLPMERVADLLLALSILMTLGYAAAPLGQVLLSKLSMMIAENRMEEIRSRLSLLICMALEVSVFISPQLLAFNDVLIRVWVGAGFVRASALVAIMLLAVPCHLLYVALCSAVDAASPIPYDSRNVFISLAAVMALAGLAVTLASTGTLLQAIAWAVVAGLALLAGLTLRTVQKLYRLRVSWRSSAAPLAVGLALGGVSMLIHRLRGGGVGIAELAVIELVMGVLFLGTLLKLGSPWLKFLWCLVTRRESSSGFALAN